jgi:hypothetical protein
VMAPSGASGGVGLAVTGRQISCTLPRPRGAQERPTQDMGRRSYDFVPRIGLAELPKVPVR